MLVSGMLFSCTNSQSEETGTTDSTGVSESNVAPIETAPLEVEEIEVDTTSEFVEADTTEAVEIQ